MRPWGGNGVLKAQDARSHAHLQAIYPSWVGSRVERGPFLLCRKCQPLSRTLAAEPMAVKPDLSNIKGTCGNPLPAKGESLGSHLGFWKVPSEMSMIERPKVDRDFILLLFSSRGTAPWKDQVSSWPGVLHLLGYLWHHLKAGEQLVVFAPVWPGAELGSPQDFSPAQAGDRTQNGGYPAAQELPLLAVSLLRGL